MPARNLDRPGIPSPVEDLMDSFKKVRVILAECPQERRLLDESEIDGFLAQVEHDIQQHPAGRV
jgi:hypothetical protein